MKYIKTFEARKTNVMRKMELLEMLALVLTDEGIDVRINNGSNDSNYSDQHIIMYIKDDDNILTRPISESYEIKQFMEILRSHNMNTRGSSGGDDFIVYYFDKYGKMTDSDSWKNF